MVCDKIIKRKVIKNINVNRNATIICYNSNEKTQQKMLGMCWYENLFFTANINYLLLLIILSVK